jgi:hypothetical protein
MNINPSKISGPYSLLTVFLLVVESFLGYWIFKADNSTERMLSGLFMVFIFATFLIVVLKVLKLSTKDEKNQFAKIYVYKNQHGSYLNELRQFLKINRPQRIDLIEYSTATIDPILQEMKKYRCKIRILLQHPSTSISLHQKNRILKTLDDRFRRTFADYGSGSIEVIFYCFPGSIRGRNFDDQLVTLGWYTYSSDPKEFGNINGDSNPMIAAHTGTKYGKYLLKMFQKAFDELWDHPGTVRLNTPWNTPIPLPEFSPPWHQLFK